MTIRKIASLMLALILISAAAVSCAQPGDGRQSDSREAGDPSQSTAAAAQEDTRTNDGEGTTSSETTAAAAQTDPGAEITSSAGSGSSNPLPQLDPGFTVDIIAGRSGRYCTALLSEGNEGDALGKTAYKRLTVLERDAGMRFILSEAPGVSSTNVQRPVFEYTKNRSIAGEPADCVIMPMDAGSLLTEGLFLDLNRVDTLDFGKEWWAAGINSEIAVNGKQFGATGDIFCDLIPYTRAVLFNRGLCAAQGVDIGQLQSLVLSGSFTFDSFLEAVTAAASGGVYGLSLDFGQNDNSFALLAANEISVIANRDGAFVYDYTPDRLILIGEKLFGATVKPAVFSDKPHDDVFNKLTSGGLCFMTASLSMAEDPSLSSISGGFGFLPLPKYNQEQSEYHSYVGRSGTGMFAMPSISQERIGAVGSVLEYLAFDARTNVSQVYADNEILSGASKAGDTDRDMIGIILASRCSLRCILYSDEIQSLQTCALNSVKEWLTNSSANKDPLQTMRQSLLRSLESYSARLSWLK